MKSLSAQGSLADFSVLESRLGHTFATLELLQTALTHKSYHHEHPSKPEDNERLEFLGDAVLDLAMAHLLMEKYPHYPEGELSSLRAFLVNENFLAKQANHIELGEWLFLGKGEEHNGGRYKPSLLANAYEAVLGAIYLERGFAYSLQIIQNLFNQALIRTDTYTANSKSELQEYLQAHQQTRPRYEVIGQDGPEHKKSFVVVVWAKDKKLAQGIGHSKQEAEQQAAYHALQILKESKQSQSDIY